MVLDDANYNFDVYCLQETKIKELDINIGDRSIWKWAANKMEMVLSSIQKEGITFKDNYNICTEQWYEKNLYRYNYIILHKDFKEFGISAANSWISTEPDCLERTDKRYLQSFWRWENTVICYVPLCRNSFDDDADAADDDDDDRVCSFLGFFF